MTPKELYIKIFTKSAETGLSVDEQEKQCLELIQQAKSEWCKEQRISCIRVYGDCFADDCTVIYTENAILNAPEP